VPPLEPTPGFLFIHDGWIARRSALCAPVACQRKFIAELPVAISEFCTSSPRRCQPASPITCATRTMSAAVISELKTRSEALNPLVVYAVESLRRSQIEIVVRVIELHARQLAESHLPQLRWPDEKAGTNMPST
jgi:hypothetical protein